jgi:hypothetical protein
MVYGSSYSSNMVTLCTVNKVLLFEMSQLSSTDQAKMDRLHNGVKTLSGCKRHASIAPQIPGKKFDNVTQAIGINAKQNL